MLFWGKLRALGRAKTRAGGVLRLAAAPAWPLRATSPALLGLAAPPHNSLRSLRSLRSNTCGEYVHEARCARGLQALRCSAPQMRCARRPPTSSRSTDGSLRRKASRRHRAGGSPCRAPAARGEERARRPLLAFLSQRTGASRKDVGGCPAARICGAEQRRARGRARSALRGLTRRGCSSEANAVSAASSATDHEPEHRSAVGPCNGPTAAAKRRRVPAHRFARSDPSKNSFTVNSASTPTHASTTPPPMAPSGR